MTDRVLSEAIALAEATIAGARRAPLVWSSWDSATGSVTHLVRDADGAAAMIIDSVLGCDFESGQVTTDAADRLARYVEEQGIEVRWHAETHVHADHLTAATYLKRRLGGELVISAGARRVAERLAPRHGISTELAGYDRFVRDGDRLPLGGLEAIVLETIGHTPSDISLLIGDALFVGDTLFMPDLGTARTDFPGGDAEQLYQSAMRLFALPEGTRMFVCHDYPDGVARAPSWETTVGAQIRSNIHLTGSADAAAYRAIREGRDRTLAEPRMMRRALQHNLSVMAG